MKDGLTSVTKEMFNRDPAEVRASRISSVFREKAPKVKDYVGEAKSLREHILRMSLFPNVANAKFLRASG